MTQQSLDQQLTVYEREAPAALALTTEMQAQVAAMFAELQQAYQTAPDAATRQALETASQRAQWLYEKSIEAQAHKAALLKLAQEIRANKRKLEHDLDHMNPTNPHVAGLMQNMQVTLHETYWGNMEELLSVHMGLSVEDSEMLTDIMFNDYESIREDYEPEEIEVLKTALMGAAQQINAMYAYRQQQEREANYGA